MAGRGPSSFKKRQKEEQRKQKQQEKRAKRLERRRSDQAGEQKPDDDGQVTEAQSEPEPTGENHGTDLVRAERLETNVG